MWARSKHSCLLRSYQEASASGLVDLICRNREVVLAPTVSRLCSVHAVIASSDSLLRVVRLHSSFFKLVFEGGDFNFGSIDVECNHNFGEVFGIEVAHQVDDHSFLAVGG